MSEWRKVEDGLPPDESPVWGYLGDRSFALVMCWKIGKAIGWDPVGARGYEYELTDSVTHWMPVVFPDPPKFDDPPLPLRPHSR